MRDFAIFNYLGIGENQGGARGYLFNLFEGMKEIDKEIPFFYVMNLQNSVNSNKSISKFSNPILQEMRSFFYILKKGFLCKKRVDKQIHNYNTVHVHSCEDVFYLRKFVKYRGNIILTPHRPETLADEKITVLKLRYGINWVFPLLKNMFTMIEKYGYKKSQGFIFPSEGAMKIYNKFPGFKRYSHNKPVRFVFTGVLKRTPTISLAEYREKLTIDKKYKVLCFIGRHNYIKGYDLLTTLADRFEGKNIKVICAGAKDLLPFPDSQNWIELGYIKDPYNLMNASDIVVIPNRNTYFDLIIVEALSLGKIVITSNTGGNLDIAQQTRGLRLFESGNAESLYKTIIETFKLSDIEKEKIASENLDFYNRNCTLVKFAENYLKAVEQVVNCIGEKSKRKYK